MTERADETTSRVAPPHGFAPAVRATVAAGPWRVAVVVVAVWSVAVVAATGTMLDVARHVVPAAAALVAGLAALGWARTAGRTARASALLGAGAIVWAFAALIDASGELRSPSDVETTVAVLEITAHFLIIAAFLVLPIDGARVRHVRALLDIVMILVATSTIAAGLRLLWLDDPGTEGGVVDFVLHPAVALLTFGLVADTLGRVPPRWRHPIAWCTAATALMVLAEFAGAAFEFGATAEPGWLTPSLWVAAWLVFAFAVRAPVDVHVPRVWSGDAGWTAVVIAVLAVGFMVWIELRHGVLHEEPSLVALGLIGTVAILLRAIAFQVESAALQRDLQRQERLASERADRYEEALEAAGAGIWEFDVVRDRVWTSRGLDQMLDRAAEGTETFDEFLQSVSPTARSLLVDQLHKISDETSAEAVEFVTARSDGDDRLAVETRGRGRRDDSGRLVSLTGVALDVTERRRADEALRRHAERSTKLVDFGRRTLAATTLDAVVWDALDVIADDVGLAACSVLQRDPVGHRLRSVASLGSGRRASTDDQVNRAVATVSTSLITVEPANHDDEPATIGACIPISAERGVWGVIDLEVPAPATLDDDDIRFVEALATMVASAAARDTAHTELRHRSLHDQLTGLPNRELVTDRVGQLLVAARATGDGVVVFHIGLDRFGQINDSLGHQAGDDALVEIGRRLAAVCPTGGSVARAGGDEFVLAFPHGPTSDPETVADAVQREVARPLWIDGSELFVTASIGEAHSAPGVTPDVLLANAATASRGASAAGGGCRRQFSLIDRERSVDRVRIEADLRHALRQGQIVPWYQPIVRIADRRIVGAEALARWERPGGGVVSPADFIPVAERAGLAGQLGRVILGRAMDDACRWVGPNGERPRVSVNVATPQLVDGSIVDVLGDEIARSGLEPDRLTLEVVEGEIVDANYERALESVRAVKRFDGLGVSVDDFGTGHSSLARLHAFPVDVVKIDRSFVARIESDAADRALVKAIIDMSAALALRVVAEGVETEGQFELLRSLGCDFAQGWLFAPAMPAHDLLALPLDEFVADGGQSSMLGLDLPV